MKLKQVFILLCAGIMAVVLAVVCGPSSVRAEETDDFTSFLAENVETEDLLTLQEDDTPVLLTTEEDLRAAIEATPVGEETTLTVSGQILLSSSLYISEGQIIRITGQDSAELKASNASSWEADGIFVVAGELSLENVTVNGGFTRGLAVAFTNIYVNENGRLTIEDNTVIKGGNGQYDKNFGCAGGINNAGTLIMNGGRITANYSVYKAVNNNRSGAAKGAGVLNTGTFFMYGGKIDNNKTYETEGYFGSGGGIYNAGQLEIYGGTITLNSAAFGGGICNLGTCIIDGDTVEISKNTASCSYTFAGGCCGGGIYVDAGSVNFRNGIIKSNLAQNHTTATTSGENANSGIYQGNGGGVFVSNTGSSDSPATFVMTGGVISGNKASGKDNSGEQSVVNCGGGIFVCGGSGENDPEYSSASYHSGAFQAGVCVVTGGLIEGNTAIEKGNGIYVGCDAYSYSTGHLGVKSGFAVNVKGPSSLVVGDNFFISDNVYLCRQCEINIDQEMKDQAFANITMEDVTEDAVMASYEESLEIKESDADRFIISDGRTFKVYPNDRLIRAEKPDLAEVAEMSLSEDPLIYTGTALQPDIFVTLSDGSQLVENTDYTISCENNLNAGTATVSVTGINGFKGTMTKAFEIQPKDLLSEDLLFTESDLTKGQLSYTFTGKELIPPASTVSINDESRGKILLRNTDYTLSFEDNINAGTAWLVVSGKGNYGGPVRFPYTISPAEITTINISRSSFTYDGTECKPAVTVKAGEETLTEGTDYTIAYANNVNSGTATVTVTGQGNYCGSLNKSFAITGKAISMAKVTIANTQAVYTGKVIKPAVSVKDGKKALKANTDFTVSYSNNKAVGVATVTIKGKGNYAGSVTRTFTILPKGTTVSKLTAASKGFSVKWKKQASQTTGYQIQYSTSKSFKSGNKTVTVKSSKTTSKKIIKLKAKKKYYVRIRTYRTVGKNTYYSAWSKVKTVKTK